MTGADVNLAARLDGVGTTVRQKRVLDRVSAVLCDGLPGLFGDRPSSWWRGCATYLDDKPDLAARLRAIADLIESEGL